MRKSILSLMASLAVALTVAGTPAHAQEGEVVCDLRIENPHYSDGAGSVIFKSRVACQGAGPATIRIEGFLEAFGGTPENRPPGPGRTVTSDETRIVANDGRYVTFYTPAPGGAKMTGNGWYRGSVRGTVVAPPGTVNSATGNDAYVVTP